MQWGRWQVFRYETGGSAGAPKNFTAGPAPGTNTHRLSFEGGGTETQVAEVPGRKLAGEHHVANYGYPVKIFAPDGSSLGSIRRHQPAASRSEATAPYTSAPMEGAVYKFMPDADRPA